VFVKARLSKWAVGCGMAVALFEACPLLWAAPSLTQIGSGLYCYISDNDGSANSTFLVGDKGILVVDTGVDEKEGAKLLQSIRSVSPLPILYIVNTHYHKDHQGGNSTVGPGAKVISTDFTRERTLTLAESLSGAGASLQPAQITFQQKVTLHLDPYVAEIYFPGKAHTSGDALVYFPQQQAIATGDLFLNRSSPAMDQGSVSNWIRALEEVLARPIKAAVPGHFELGTKQDLQRFHDYLSDLYTQVQLLHKKQVSLDRVPLQLRLEQYSDFRQYPQYEATFSDNAKSIYKELQQAHK